jgi:hypothetical protein
MTASNRYTAEQVQWLRDNRPKLAGQALAVAFNDRFGGSRNLAALLSFCKRKDILTGRDCRFTPGFAPWNKGMKGLKLSQASQFKAGNRPHNWHPVGTERLNADGYREIKTAEPGQWRFVHVLTWENLHGPVAKGHCIMFRDGEKNNLAPANLAQVSRSELARLNKNGYGRLPAELKPVFLTLTRLEVKTRSRTQELSR